MRKGDHFIKKHPLLALCFLFYLLHLIGVAGFVSYFEWGTGRPLLTDNYAWRSALFYDTRVLFKDGRLWGYSPYHMAGCPYAVINFGSSFDQVLTLLFPFVNAFELLKLYLLFSLLAIPLLPPLIAKQFGVGSGVRHVIFIGALIFFWKYPNVSSFAWGSPVLILASCIALLSSAFFYRFLKERNISLFIGFSLLGAVALLMHPLTLIFLFTSIFSFLLSGFNRTRTALGLLLGFVLILGLNLFWILPFLHFRKYLDLSLSWDYFLTMDHITFRNWYFREDLSRLILFGFGGIGLWHWYRKRNPLFPPFLITIGILFGFLCFFPGPSFLILMRRRYDWPLILFLLVPASEFLWERMSPFFEELQERALQKFQRNQKIGGLLLTSFAVSLAIVTSDPTRYMTCVKKLFATNKSFQTAWPLPTAMVPEEQERLIQWIRTRTTPEARILIEDSLHPIHIFWRAHLPAILPFLTQREYIGGPIPEGELNHAFANFYNGTLFKKRISEIDRSFLKKYFELYNIGWIICHTPESKKALEKFAQHEVQRELNVGPFSCYRLTQKGNFFLKGKGRVRVGFDHFEISETEPEEGEIILKYHWIENLKTVPSCRIERFFYMEDPIGFIKVINPPKVFEMIHDP